MSETKKRATQIEQEIYRKIYFKLNIDRQSIFYGFKLKKNKNKKENSVSVITVSQRINKLS